MTEPQVLVHESRDELAGAVARALLDRLVAAQARGEVPNVCLTGGSIADEVHRAVLSLVESGASEVDWSRVALWWGDERFVAARSPDRNAGQAHAALLDHLPLDQALVHEAPGADEVATVADAAQAYADELRREGTGAFEVTMLGVGPDGHVASLFPGQPALDADHDVAVPVTASPKPPPERVSLTFAALNRSRAVWFLVAGADKADAVAAALAGGDPHAIPARGVAGSEETVWHVDGEAAAALG